MRILADGFGIRRCNAFRDRCGAAYVVAVTALLVGVIAALALLRAGNACFSSEASRSNKRAAVDLAEAGLDYAYWRVHYNSTALPFTASVTSSAGTISVTATDDGARSPSTMLVTSTGTRGAGKRSSSCTLKRVALGLLPYDYAVCTNGDLSINSALVATGTAGGIRSNGLIDLGSPKTQVTTGAWAVSTISTKGTVSPQYPGSPPVAFPDIDYTYYNSIATQVFNQDTTFTSLSYPGSSAVIVVNGNVTISGVYDGICTVVATNDVTVNADLTPANPQSFLALISGHVLGIQVAVSSVQAVLYCHRADNTGEIQVRGRKTVVGSMGADVFTCNNTTTLQRDSGLNLDVIKQLKLPGF